MEQILYEPIIEVDEETETSTLNLEKTLKQPLQILEELIKNSNETDVFDIKVFIERYISQLSQRDMKEIEDIISDPQFVFTDDKTVAEKTSFDLGDIKDLYYELKRRRYLDLKYNLEYIMDTLITPNIKKKFNVYLGESAIALDSVTIYKYINAYSGTKNLQTLGITYKSTFDQNAIHYTKPFVIDNKNCVEDMVKDIFNENNKLGINIRDRKRDLKYHYSYISIDNMTISQEIKQKLREGGIPIKEEALMEGSEYTSKCCKNIAVQLYNSLLSKGYRVTTDSRYSIISSIIWEMIWEYTVLLKSESPRHALVKHFSENDLVVMSTKPALRVMSKVLFYPKRNINSYNTVSITIPKDVSSGSYLIDTYGTAMGRVLSVNQDGSEIIVAPNVMVSKSRCEIKPIKLPVEEVYTEKVRQRFELEDNEFRTFTSFIHPNYLRQLKIMIPAYEIDELQHHISYDFNIRLDNEELLEKFNPIPWKVMGKTDYISDKGLYHKGLNAFSKGEE